MPAKLDIDAKKVADLYRQGLSAKKIGWMLDCSKGPVLRILHELGTKLRGRRVDVDVKRMAELYEQGFTSREIALMLSCSKNTVLHARSKRRFSELIGSSLARKREILEKVARFYS